MNMISKVFCLWPIEEGCRYELVSRFISFPRGMFTMATSHPVLTETLPIPPLDLTGRAPPR